jgi:hypothetical protein
VKRNKLSRVGANVVVIVAVTLLVCPLLARKKRLGAFCVAPNLNANELLFTLEATRQGPP